MRNGLRVDRRRLFRCRPRDNRRAARQNRGDERALERGGRDRPFVKDVIPGIQRRIVEEVRGGKQIRHQRKAELLHESSVRAKWPSC